MRSGGPIYENQSMSVTKFKSFPAGISMKTKKEPSSNTQSFNARSPNNKTKG
jgi:hypothetical protein